MFAVQEKEAKQLSRSGICPELGPGSLITVCYLDIVPEFSADGSWLLFEGAGKIFYAQMSSD
ncbi:hypothetical protein [Salinisphaera sp. G21_0]|uniref:hypothetical protein n=1 Tax=Salinisphaera sp. G21_0 TaxID=2821094 RepID=UPI001AD980C6|nr:hypothetical protein [Salinisphaera sp. G21_0]MBO9482548.1 hypothetical protein [Salinisphaera sp. G21_0]